MGSIQVKMGQFAFKFKFKLLSCILIALPSYAWFTEYRIILVIEVVHIEILIDEYLITPAAA
jgi:hypothetical protein